MKVLIADDHQLFLDGLSTLLSSEKYVTQVISINSLKEIRAVLDESFDLVILDLRMPGMRGAKHITDLIESWPTTPFIVMSATESQADIDEVMRAGAMTFIPKISGNQQILEKFRRVIQGERFHPTLPQLSKPTNDNNEETQVPAFSHLSNRQFEVLKALANGYSNQEIASVLFITDNTVKTHLAKLFKIFEVKSRVACVQKARTLGLV